MQRLTSRGSTWITVLREPRIHADPMLHEPRIHADPMLHEPRIHADAVLREPRMHTDSKLSIEQFEMTTNHWFRVALIAAVAAVVSSYSLAEPWDIATVILASLSGAVALLLFFVGQAQHSAR